MLEFLNNGWFLIITPGKNFLKKCHCNICIHSLDFPMIFFSSVSWVFSVCTKGLKGSEPTVWCTMWRWGCRCTRIHSSAFHLHSTYPEIEQVVRFVFFFLFFLKIIITSLMCNKKNLERENLSLYQFVGAAGPLALGSSAARFSSRTVELGVTPDDRCLLGSIHGLRQCHQWFLWRWT